MKKLYAILFITFIYITVNAQTPALSWVNYYNGPVTGSDKVADMEKSTTDEIYVTGTSDSTAAGTRDIVTMKYNSSGTLIWKKRYYLNNTTNEQAAAIELDEANNAIYVVGKGDTTGRSTDMLILKYNATTGAQLWVKYVDFGMNSADQAVDVETDVAGNVFVLGDGYTTTWPTYRDVMVLKYNSSGVALSFGLTNIRSDPNYDIIAEDLLVAPSAANNVYITYAKVNGPLYANNYIYGFDNSGFRLDPNHSTIGGGVNSTTNGYNISIITIDPNSNYIYTCAPGYSSYARYTISKFNSVLDREWLVYYPSTTPIGNYIPTGIKVDHNNGSDVFVTGYGDVDTSSNTNNNIVTIKLNTSGVLQWVSPPSYDGYFLGLDDRSFAIDFPDNITPRKVVVAGYQTNGTNTKDLVLIQYDNTGTQQWTSIPFGCGVADNVPQGGMISNRVGGYFLAGYSDCNTASNDFLTMKYCSFIGGAVSASASNHTICNGSNTTLNVSGTGTFSWSPSTGLSSDIIYNPLASPNSNTIYTATVMDINGCTSSDTVSINILTNPNAPSSGGDVIVCQSDTPASVTVTPPIGCSVSWFNNSTGGILLGTGNSLGALTGGIYYAESVDSATGCRSRSRTSITLILNPNPPPPSSGGDISICQGGTAATLSVTAPPISTIEWFDVPSGGSRINTGNLYLVSVAGTYYAESIYLTSGCRSVTRTPVSLIINPNPISPGNPNPGDTVTACSNALPASISLTPPGGCTIRWFDVSSGGSILYTGNSYAASIPGTYYGESIDTSTGCSSTGRTAITLSLDSVPIATINNDSPLCEGDTLNLNSDGGTNYSWSGPNQFSSLFQNPERYNISVVDSGVYTVIITAVNGCSDTAATTVTINPAPQFELTEISPQCDNQILNLVVDSITGATYLWHGPDNFTSTKRDTFIAVASFSNTGWYSCTVTDIHGCQTTDSLEFIIDTIPHAELSLLDTNVFCDGDSARLTATQGSSYRWMPNGETTDTITATSSGIYYCIVTAPGGCNGIDTTGTIVITEHPVLLLPTFSEVGDTSLVCDVSGMAYLWYRNGTAQLNDTDQVNIIPPSENGMWQVEITDTNGCTAISFAVQTTVNIEALASSHSFRIYPNPTRNSLTIERILNSGNLKMNLQILTVFGEIVYSKMFEANQNTVNFVLAAGIYFVKIIDEESKTVQKLIIQ